MMLSCSTHRDDLRARIASVRTLLDATHQAQPAGNAELNISREARGLAIVLLFAAYENLLTTLARSILDVASRLRVGNRRLKPGLKLIAAYSGLQGLMNSNESAIWKGKGLQLVSLLDDRKKCTISTNVFPRDGSFMKASQVRAFCTVFGLADPAPILKEVLDKIDTVVSERNRIAHGSETADQIGRQYSIADIQLLVTQWETRWIEFLNWTEAAAASRDFYRS